MPDRRFFAQGHGKYVEFQSAPVAVGSQCPELLLADAFQKACRAPVVNEGARSVDSFYFNIDYRLETNPQPDARYFHTQYRTWFPAPVGKPLTICDTTGAGHFVGTFISVMANSDGWWGEGNDYWYVDGSGKPVISGTGSEDYFCGAWDFGRAFWYPYFGVPYYDNPAKGGEKRGILNTCYRWHIQDPVPFKQQSALYAGAWPERLGRGSQTVYQPLHHGRLLLPGQSRRRWAGDPGLQGSHSRAPPPDA